MAVRQVTTEFAGEVGVTPRLVRLVTDDDFATITAAGYLSNAQNTLGINFQPTDFVFCSYNGGQEMFTLSFATNGVITMEVAGADVVLPVTANHIAVFTSTSGAIGDDAATAINGGNIQAGLSGTAGYLASFPAAASKGSLRLTAVANTGNTVTTISNAAMGQASVISIPDPGQATYEFIIADSAGTQHITSGNLQVDAGSLISGLSTGGFVGKVQLFPTTTTTGSLTIQATPNGGDFAGVITNAALGQASTYTIPDAGAATANFILSAATTTQTIGTGLSIVGGNNVQITGGGNFIAGASGAAGTVISYPATATSGHLDLVAVTNTSGDFSTTISNAAAIGQSQVISIPDVGAATGQFNVVTGALTSGNIMEASGTAGKLADSGIAASNVQLKNNIIAAQSADIGGGGAGPITVNVAGLTAASVVVANILSSTNTVAVAKVAPGAGSFDITFTADPGAACVVSYVAFVAAQ